MKENVCPEKNIHYPPPQTCPSLVCIVKHILRDHATYMKQHASKRASIGRNESDDFQTAVGRFTVRSASVSGIHGLQELQSSECTRCFLRSRQSCYLGTQFPRRSNRYTTDLQPSAISYIWKGLQDVNPLRCRRIHGKQVNNNHENAYCILHSPDRPRPHRVSVPMN